MRARLDELVVTALKRGSAVTELRTGVLATLEEQLPAHRADGENLQGLLARWDGAAKDFGTSTLAILSR